MSIELTDELKHKLLETIVDTVHGLEKELRLLEPRSYQHVSAGESERRFSRDPVFHYRSRAVFDEVLTMLVDEELIQRTSPLKTVHPEYGDRALRAFHQGPYRMKHDFEHDRMKAHWHFNWISERGRLWIRCTCGAVWRALDSEVEGSIDGFDFEQLDEGHPERCDKGDTTRKKRISKKMSKRSKQTRIVPRRMKWVMGPGSNPSFFGEFGNAYFIKEVPERPYTFCMCNGERYHSVSMTACKRLARKVVTEWLNKVVKIKPERTPPKERLPEIGDVREFSYGKCRLTESDSCDDAMDCASCALDVACVECWHSDACMCFGNANGVHAYWKLCSEKGE